MKLVSTSQESNPGCNRRSNLPPLRSLRPLARRGTSLRLGESVGLSEPEAYGPEAAIGRVV